MRISIHLIAILGLGTLATGCVTKQTARIDATETLSAAPNVPQNASMITGLTSLEHGDRYTATNLFERAVDARPSMRNRFNLAVAYERTFRRQEAAEIYRGLAQDGQYAYLNGRSILAGPSAPLRRFNVADEAKARLDLIQKSYAVRRAIATPRSAEEAGTPASATVGTRTGRISDAEAQRLDANS